MLPCSVNCALFKNQLMDLEKKYPSVADMEAKALKRLPKFARDYLTGGIADGVCLNRNRTALDSVMMMPRYLSAAKTPVIQRTLFGRQYDAPFAVAPIGLAGLIWPQAEQLLAAAAKQHNIPYVLSTVATISLENIRLTAGDNAWFQYYPANDPKVEQSILQRCDSAGYETVLVTVDVPAHTRRAHDMRNGLSVPPRFDVKTVTQMLSHPRWALNMLRTGVPHFVNITPYYQGGQSIASAARFVTNVMKGHITEQRFAAIRRLWPGHLVVKGILNADEAKRYLELGADGIVVSNHGGRQADAAPSAATVLPQIREVVGADAIILADGGIRRGLDIAKMLALGADFVLLGRPFMFALAAAQRAGADHVMNVLKAELRADLSQLGCPNLNDLPHFLYRDLANSRRNDRRAAL